MEPNRDKQNKNQAGKSFISKLVQELAVQGWLFLRGLFIVIGLLFAFVFGLPWVIGVAAHLHLFFIDLFDIQTQHELNRNAESAIESLLDYSVRSNGTFESVSVSFNNCKSEHKATIRNFQNVVNYSTDWSKVDWDSLTFFKIPATNQQAWRMYCLGDCELIGTNKVKREIEHPYHHYGPSTVNTSMIKNHIQTIKLACLND